MMPLSQVDWDTINTRLRQVRGLLLQANANDPDDMETDATTQHVQMAIRIWGRNNPSLTPAPQSLQNVTTPSPATADQPIVLVAHVVQSDQEANA